MYSEDIARDSLYIIREPRTITVVTQLLHHGLLEKMLFGLSFELFRV